jgi:glycosyltransferase involved in cell wall biosynthesis
VEIAVVGVSLSPNCGVRDHARLLAAELAAEQLNCTFHWLQRSERSFRGSRAEIRAWTRGLSEELGQRRPDAILFHYSVFTCSHKGIPLFVPAVLSALRPGGVPLLSIMHEFAYPWGYGGWRGVVWAVTQRAALFELMRASTSVIVTADPRATWLASRSWLPKRRVLAAPVFSNLPPPAAIPPAQREPGVIGLFGYSYQGAAVSLILDALADLRAGGLPARLKLLGAPGPASPAGEGWRAQARARGLEEALSFTGALPAQALSDALAACELLLFADTAGPSPRKGTLAGSLASGRPVVAIDGPVTWPELVTAGAVRLAAPTPRGLAEAIAGLLGDEVEREALAARSRDFSHREMGVERTARATRALLEDALSARRA